jgi:hypothetical protein
MLTRPLFARNNTSIYTSRLSSLYLLPARAIYTMSSIPAAASRTPGIAAFLLLLHKQLAMYVGDERKPRRKSRPNMTQNGYVW